MGRAKGYSAERCMLALRGYWDEIDRLLDSLDILSESGDQAALGLQVNLARLISQLQSDIDVRQGPSAIWAMNDIESIIFLPTLITVRDFLTCLSMTPDRSWSFGLARAQRVLQESSRELAFTPSMNWQHRSVALNA